MAEEVADHPVNPVHHWKPKNLVVTLGTGKIRYFQLKKLKPQNNEET